VSQIVRNCMFFLCKCLQVSVFDAAAELLFIWVAYLLGAIILW